MSTKQTIEFKFSGLDQDSDARLMTPGDSRYRLNCINDSTDDGMLGDIQNIKGTTLFSHSQPPGVNTCIGSCKDTQNNAIIYFVYNSQDIHQIRRFYPDTGTDEVILESTVLNFQITHRIYHANVINGLLYWTDGWFESYTYDGGGVDLQFNPPRKLNIQKAIDYSQGSGGYNTISFEILDRIKYQPPFAATLRYIYDAANIENYLYGKLFQFTYRYIFDDKEISTWASLSKVLMPIYNYKENNIFELLENNIGVTLWSGSEIVTEIEIAVRVNDSYFIVSRLNKAEVGIGDDTAYEYIYNGIGYKENLTAEDFLRPYDYVPQVSQSQEIAGGRMTDANVTEDYDDVDLNMTFEFIRYDKLSDVRDTSPGIIATNLPNTLPWGTAINTMQYPIPTFKSDGVYQPSVTYYDRASRAGDYNTREEYVLLTPSYDVGLFPMNGMLMDPLKLRYEINHQPPAWAKYWSFGLTKELSYLKKEQILLTARNFDLKDGKIALPIGTNYNFDEGDRVRLIAVMSPQSATDLNDLFTYQSMVNDYFYLPFTNSNNNLISQASSTFNYKIDEYDPSTLQLVLTKEDAKDMKQYVQGELAPGSEKASAFPYYSSYYYLIEVYNKNRPTTENKVFFDIGERFEVGDAYTATRYHKCNVQDQIIGSQPAIGEVYGFDAYLRRKKSLLNDQTVLLSIFNPTLDFIHTSPSDNVINFNPNVLEAFNDSVLGIVGDYTGTALLLTPSQAFGGYLGFNQPQEDNVTIPNLIYLSQNSGSWQPVPPGNEIPGWISFFGTIEVWAWQEDTAYADDYESTVYNDGRPGTNLSTTARKDYISRIRWSGKLFENTLINELSTVYAGSYKDLSETYNEISRIRQVGDTLKVRQKNKMTSFYLDKNMLNVNEGVDNVGQSSDFLSTPNIYEEFYGSSSPGADIQAIRTGYFADLINGVIIRDSGNKPLPISGDDDSAQDRFRMAKHFRDLFRQIRQVGEENFNIHAVWDEFSSLYTFTVQDLRETPTLSETIVFHEPTNRWKSFMSYVPEKYESLGKYLISFKDGQPYVHYDNDLRNYFLGTQYGQELRTTINIGRNSIKVFENIDVYSNIAWECPTITIPSTPNAPTGMLSRIPASKFVAKEGVWHSAFLRDQNDPKYTGNILGGLLNGRRLRGDTMEIIMTNNETSLVYLQSLNIYVTPSELTA